MKTTILILVVPLLMDAQTVVNGGRTFMGKLDASGASSTVPYRTGTGSPSGRDACGKPGETYFQTDAAAGRNLWTCTAAGTPGTWTSPSTVGVNLDGTGQGSFSTLNLVTPTGLNWSLTPSGSTLNVTPTPDTTYLLSQAAAQNGAPFLCAPANGGGGTTYTCNTTPARASYTNGMVVEFRPDVTCAGGVTTLNINSLGVKKIFKVDGATNPAASDCRAGSHYWLMYNTGLDGAAGAFEFKSLLGNTSGGALTSVFGRTGVVTAQTGDYTAAQVTNAFDKSAANSLGANAETMTDITTPANPSAGTTRFYAKGGKLCSLDSSGNENCTGTTGGGGGGLPDPGSNGFVVRTATGSDASRTITGGTGITCANGDGVAGNPVCGIDTTVAVTQTQFQNLAPLVFNGTLSGNTYSGTMNPSPVAWVDANSNPLSLSFCPNTTWTGGAVNVNPGPGTKRVFVYGSDPPANVLVSGSCYLLVYKPTMTVDGLASVGAFELKSLPEISPYLSFSNAAATGTTLYKLAKLTGAPSTAVNTSTSDTSGAVGITVAGAGTTLNATIQRAGLASCVFDGATVAGHYVQISSSVAGDCHDSGASYPASGQVIGRVVSTNGAAGTYTIDLFGAEIQAASGGGGGSGYATIAGNGASAPQRNTANFSNEFTVVDNAGSSRTDISISTIAGAKVSGNIPGNAATATALAANGANCAAGQPALGVDAGGNAEGCAALTAAQVTNAFDKSAANSLGANAETMTDITTPANPSAGTTRFYAKGGKLCSLDSSGNENCTGTTGGGGGGLPDPGSNGFVVRTATGADASRTITGGTGITCANGDGVAGNPVCGIDTTVAVTQTQFQNLAPLVFNGTLSGNTYSGTMNPSPVAWVDANSNPLSLSFCPNTTWTGGAVNVNPGPGTKRVFVYGSDPPANVLVSGSCYLLVYKPTMTVDGLASVGAFELKSLPEISPYLSFSNAAATGTTLYKLAKLTGAPSTAVNTSTSDTSGVVGITVAGAGTTLNATIQRAGLASCVFDGATVAGHYVQISSSVAGDCRDSGASYPASGQVIGRVISTNGAAGTYTIDLFGAEIQAASGGGGGGTVTSIGTTGPISGGTITATGTISCPTCVTGSTLTSGQLLRGAGGQALQTGDLTGDVTTAGGLATTIAANAVTSSKMAIGNTRHSCVFENDTQTATPLTNSQITGHSCQVPANATVVEVVVAASGGTPSILLERYRPSDTTTADLLSGALATGASGAYACANGTVSTLCGISNVTSSSSTTIANTALTKGDVIRIKSATAGGAATWHNVSVWYTLN